MFDPKTYASRRQKLRQSMGDKTLLILGHSWVPRNYQANFHPFRQNSHFWYFAGHPIADMALLMTPEEDILFGYEPNIDDIIWTGPLPSMQELGAQVGIGHVEPSDQLKSWLSKFSQDQLHYLRPYQGMQILWLADLFETDPATLASGASEELANAISSIRIYKQAQEIAQIEKALDVSYAMYSAAARTMAPGKKEWQVQAAMVACALGAQCEQSFAPIVTIHGEVLHNHSYHNTLPDGGLLLMDSGAETNQGYASDITRTFPINGRFTTKQREIYQVVLDAQQTATQGAMPGISMKELHLAAATTIAKGLISLGLMRGDAQEAVQQGAHALFFPHGLGHMMGVDVHDMEDLGDVVGYGPGIQRDTQFGLNFLRMARKLEPGFVFTVEPGVYFIPPLIDKWAAEKQHASFINYEALNRYRDFGGVRIEDDIWVTQDDAVVLGKKPIPKEPDEVEVFIDQQHAQ